MVNFSFERQIKDITIQDDVERWEKKKLELWAALKPLFEGIFNTDQDKYKPFRITIDKPRGVTMAAYWVLIKNLQHYYLEDVGQMYIWDSYGRIYNVNIDEQLSDWVKVEAGHCDIVEVNGKKHAEPREIKYKSGCTWQNMKQLLDFLLRFGEENNIIGLELKPKDEDKMKKGFGG